MEKLEKIIRYLDGEVIGEEKQLFEKEIASDQELASEVGLVKNIDEIITDTELVKFVNTIKTIRNTNSNSYSFESHSPNKIWSLRTKLLAAASVAALITVSIIWLFNTQPTNDKLFSQYYTRYDNCIVTRGESETDDLIIAIQLYDKKKYSEAINKFNGILRQDQANTAAYFFLGISYMEIKDFEKASSALNSVIMHKDTAFMEHAEWYLALCYLKIQKVDKAKSILKNIASGNSFYYNKAAELLQKL